MTPHIFPGRCFSEAALPFERPRGPQQLRAFAAAAGAAQRLRAHGLRQAAGGLGGPAELPGISRAAVGEGHRGPKSGPVGLSLRLREAVRGLRESGGDLGGLAEDLPGGPKGRGDGM